LAENEKTPTAEEPKVEVKESTDLNELVVKAVADAKALVDQEKEEKRQVDPVMQDAINRAVADIMAKQKDAQEEKADAEVKKVDSAAKPEHKGIFTENKAGGFQLSYKAMLDRPAWDEKSLRIQELNDDVYLMSLLLGKSPDQFTSAAGVAMAQELKGLTGMELKGDGPLYSTLAGSGDEWVPTGWSNQIFKTMELFGKVEPMFKNIDMPRDPFKIPVQTSRATAFIHSEPTANAPSKYTASAMATDDMTLTTTLLAARTVYSDIYDEDGIAAQLPWIKADLAKALQYGKERAILDGDDNGTHQDTGDAPVSPDVRVAWDGLRFFALAVENSAGTATKTPATKAAFSATLANIVRGKMGKYAANPKDLAWFMGPQTWIQAMRDTTVQTADKYPRPTNVSGELGNHGGIAIIVSELVREDLNASGVYDGSTTDYSCPLLVNHREFVVGKRRDIKVDSYPIKATDSSEVWATCRSTFMPLEETIKDVSGSGTSAHGVTPIGCLYYVDSTTTA